MYFDINRHHMNKLQRVSNTWPRRLFATMIQLRARADQQVGFLLGVRVLLTVSNKASLSADLGSNVIVRQTSS